MRFRLASLHNLRSIFGNALPSLETKQSIQKLEGQGYDFGMLPHPKRFERESTVLNTALDHYLCVLIENPQCTQIGLEGLVNITDRIGGLTLDFLRRSPKQFESFVHYPEEEYSTFVDMLIKNAFYQTPIHHVVPLCPDYRDQYKLSSDIGNSGRKILNVLSTLRTFYQDRGFSIDVTIHLADVEAFDEELLVASNETTDSFLQKVEQTKRKIQNEIDQMGMSPIVHVGSMSEAFDARGISYFSQQAMFSRQLLSPFITSRKVRKLIGNLVTEREKVGDFRDIPEERHSQIAANELGGYVAYGKFIGGSAVILSPDASSAVPAYNILSGKHEISPAIHIR